MRNQNLDGAGKPGAMGGMGPMGGASKGDQLKAQAKDFMSNKVLTVDMQDERIWQLLTDVPLVSKPLAVVFFILNVILPGFGTMFAACAHQGEYVSKTQISLGLI